MGPPGAGYAGVDNNFNVIVKGNFTVPDMGGSETEGRIAVGGNFILERDYYGVGTSGGGTFVVGPDRADNLIVRGSIQRTASATGYLGNAQSAPSPLVGKVRVGGTVPATVDVSSGGFNDIQANQGTAAIDALININSVFANLATKSACYTALPATGSFLAANNTLRGDNTSPIQVFNLTTANISGLANQNLLFSGIPAGATIIINVLGTVVNWDVSNVAASIANDPNYSFFGTTDPDVDVRRVLFNFGTASSVTFNAAISGSVLVPIGNVVLNGNLNGRLAVGGNLTHSAEATEIHNYPFEGSCTCAACALTATVTPGACNTATNTYSATVVVGVTNASAGTLTLSLPGTTPVTQPIAATTTSVTKVFTGLVSDGVGHTLTVSLPGCSTITTAYTAPASCTQPAAVPRLMIDQLVSASKARVGNLLTYTLVLTNTGTAPATSVVVRDSVSTGLRYVSGSATPPAGTSFVQGMPVSTWTVGTISPGQSVTMTFRAIADSSGVLYSKATIPGDVATVCTSIPVLVCVGNQYSFSLTAIAGRTSYRWYRTYQGVTTQLTSFTANTLTVSQPGAYSLATNPAAVQCADYSCCPYIVEEDTLPTFQAVAIAATCVGNTPQPTGRLILSQFRVGYTYQYSAGASFNPVASLSGSAQAIPANGVIVSNLANPAVAKTYTIRVYNSAGCHKDVSVTLMPAVCPCPANVCIPFMSRKVIRAR